MVEGKLYKTKLCLLYQNGRCTRHSCNFAHGSAELRVHNPPFEGEWNRRGRDFQGRSIKWHSPPRREWEDKEHHAYIDHAPSSSLEKRSQRKRKFYQREVSENENNGYLSDDRLGDRSFRSPSSKNTIFNELKQVQSDIKKSYARKVQLQCFLEERDKEVDALSFRLKELEAQLYEEREESHRVASKVKKFVKAHHRNSRIQDELKRSRARLHKIGVQLASHITSYSAQGEDWTMNALSEDEGGNLVLHSACLFNEERHEAEAIRSNRPSQSQQNRWSSLANHKKGKSGCASSAVDRKKTRSSDVGLQLPSTGIAAHADEEGAHLMATEKPQAVEIAFGATNHGSQHELTDIQLMPSLPLLDKDNYSKNKSKEDTLDEDAVHVDVV